MHHIVIPVRLSNRDEEPASFTVAASCDVDTDGRVKKSDTQKVDLGTAGTVFRLGIGLHVHTNTREVVPDNMICKNCVKRQVSRERLARNEQMNGGDT